MSINRKKISFIYFFIQLISSSVLLIRIILNYISTYNNFTNYITFISICLKLGIPPFHYWFVIISIYINWNTIFLLFTIQKIIPLIIISYIQPHSAILSTFVLLAILVPPFIAINLSNFKKILAYSSINQSRWIIIIISTIPSLWTMYLITYSISLKIIVDLITIKKIILNIILKSNISLKILIISLSLNLSGLPPFIFFIIKWYRIFLFIIDLKINILVIIMLLRSFIIIYVYINIIVKVSLTNFTYPKALGLCHIKNKTTKIKSWFIILIRSLSFVIVLV